MTPAELITQWERLARSKFLSAEHEADDMGRHLIEHGAMCYFNCASELRKALADESGGSRRRKYEVVVGEIGARERDRPGSCWPLFFKGGTVKAHPGPEAVMPIQRGDAVTIHNYCTGFSVATSESVDRNGRRRIEVILTCLPATPPGGGVL